MIIPSLRGHYGVFLGMAKICVIQNPFKYTLIGSPWQFNGFQPNAMLDFLSNSG
jgi:hypothetical protein